MRLFSRISKFLSPLIYLFIVPSFAFAQGVNVSPIPSGNFAPLASLGASNFGKIVGNVITIAFVLSALIALVFLVYGGVKWITSGGDKAAVEGARNTIVAAVIGLVIVFLSYFVLNIILGFFNLSLGDLQLPKITAF
ncbi:MAG TPA: hypothetical protein VKC89_03150 [Patescibacteria group bacterium]|nr:hypothetical protein [Patescibacteria group bacterium]